MPVTTTQPMRRLPSNLAISRSVGSGLVGKTSPPLNLRISATFILRFLQPENFSPIGCDILSRSGKARKRRENRGQIQRLKDGLSCLRSCLAPVEQTKQEEPA